MYPLKHTHPSSWLLSSSSGFQKKPAMPWQKPLNLPFFAEEGPIQASISMSLSNSFNNSAHSVEIGCKGNVQPRSSPVNSSPLTPLDFLERAAVVHGDRPSILYNETTRTWSETHIRCLKLASSIVSLGIRRGDVVSVVAPNVPAMCELHFAVPMAGAILNTVNLRLDANAISNLLQHSGSKLVFVDCESASLVYKAVYLFPSHLQRPVLVLIRDEDVKFLP